MRLQLYDQSERYRKLESSLVKHRDPDDEHKRIAEAAVARNVTLATRLMTEHIALTTDNIIKTMERKAGSLSRTAPPRLSQNRSVQLDGPRSKPAMRNIAKRR